MTPDTGQPLELLVGTLAAILAVLHRLLKSKRRGNLRLTLSVTEENSNESPPDSRTNEADGRRTDTDQQ